MLAFLLNDIEFVGINNERITLLKDTVVAIDHLEGIAVCGDHCFDIFDYEYKLLN